MIIQSLISYYDRLYHKDDVPHFGFSVENIGFALCIDKHGNMTGDTIDLRTKIKTNVYEYKQSIVPYSNSVNVRSGKGAAKTPNFMVDKADYIFGMSRDVEKNINLNSFINLIDEVCPDSHDAGINAVKNFFKNWKPKDSKNLRFWKEISGTHGKWIGFKLEGEPGFIHERDEVKKCWRKYIQKNEYKKGISLTDGQLHQLQPQYSQFKFDSGASLVSFNESAYESYGKKRGANACISVEAEFKSSSALKYLFRSKKQRIKIGDATTIFWAENNSPVESFFGVILDPKTNSDENIPLRKFLEAASKGTKPDIPQYDGKIRFFILGFSVNKARLAVRFWHVCSVDQLKDRIGKHFKDLHLKSYSRKDLEFPGIWHLLRQTTRDSKNISPLLGGSLIRSILEGLDYPLNLFNGVLNRIRADQRINHLRASILKAVLVRNFNMEVPMSLDKENKDIAYQLGRLFAILEKAQKDALGESINSTIKDRFYGSASCTPAGVFPKLLRLTQHHIEKAEYGYVSDRRIAEIMEDIDSFPAYLNMKQQGMFSIAYYHQRNEIYKTKNQKK